MIYIPHVSSLRTQVITVISFITSKYRCNTHHDEMKFHHRSRCRPSSEMSIVILLRSFGVERLGEIDTCHSSISRLVLSHGETYTGIDGLEYVCPLNSVGLAVTDDEPQHDLSGVRSTETGNLHGLLLEPSEFVESTCISAHLQRCS